MNQNGHIKGAKLPFSPPKLEVYGRARDITRTVGGTGAVDSTSPAGSGPNKTSLP